MSDLVERLRVLDGLYANKLGNEAADEIESLQMRLMRKAEQLAELQACRDDAFVAVPKVATEAMVQAGVKAIHGDAVYKNVSASGLATMEDDVSMCYSRMLAALPASTASPEVSVVADKQQQGDLGVALSERPDQSTNGGTPQDTSISERLRVNRQELMQNGTCAYMSPRPNGLWVNWHLVAEAIAEIERLQGLPDTIQGLQALRGRIDGKLHRLVMGDPRATVGSHSAGSNDSTMSKSTESGAAVDKGETGNG